MTLAAPISRIEDFLAQPACDASPVTVFAGAAPGPAVALLSREPSAPAIPTPEALDRALHAVAARLTGGLSPAAVRLAFADWLLHLATSPGKQMALAFDALQTSSRLAQQLLQPATLFQPWRLVSPP